jgi:hypothetical protein
MYTNLATISILIAFVQYNLRCTDVKRLRGLFWGLWFASELDQAQLHRMLQQV